MYTTKPSNRKYLSLLAFLLVFSLGLWSCGGDAGEQTEGENTEVSTDDTPSEHPEGEHPDSEHPVADTMAQDSIQHSEHPSGGSEHPKN